MANINDVKPQLNIEDLRERVQDAVIEDDIHAAKDVIRDLAAAGFNYDVAGGREEQKLYRAMLFVRFAQVPEKECVYLLQNSLLEGLRLAEFDLVQKIANRLDFMLLQEEQIEFLEKLEAALKNNQELLGSKPIAVEGNQRQQMLKFWLSDYDAVPKQPSIRDNLQQVDYMTKSINVKQLAPPEQDVLRKLLKIYDLTRNSLYEYHNAQEVDILELKDVDVHLLTASPEELESGTGSASAAPKPLATPPPVVPRPAPKSPPAPQPVKPVPSQPPPPLRITPEAKNQLADMRLQPDIKIGSGRSAINIQELLNREYKAVDVDGTRLEETHPDTVAKGVSLGGASGANKAAPIGTQANPPADTKNKPEAKL